MSEVETTAPVEITKQPHHYRDLEKEKLEEVFSNFLIDSWSFSKVSAFARNEKAFEMVYIYRNPIKVAASSVSGDAYHKALDFFFTELQQGIKQDLAALQVVAFEAVDSVESNKWKLQKTTPTIEECKTKANESSVSLLQNFFKEISLYESELAEILAVELYCDEFLTINGVDIPLPCRAKIDLVIKTNDGKIVIIDHKSKSAFSDEKELKFSIGKQAMTYVKSYETKTGIEVNEVWFIENKISQNRDKSPQLSCFKMVLDKDVRRLYEAMLYEPLKRMIEAVSNPDYVYLINESDNFIDKAEIYEFWAQSMIAEVTDYNFIPESKKDLISKRLKKIRDTSLATVDPRTIKKFRENASEFIQYDLTNKNMTKEQKIEHTLRTLGVIVNVAKKFDGYSSDTFLLEVSAGTNLSSVHRYKLDIANALNVSSIRMMKDLFVYEGKSYLAVESAKQRERDLIFDLKYLHGHKIPIGLDNFNQTVVWDMDNPSTPHALICGSTGSGKSVCIISIIEYAKQAGMDDIIIFDPKYEFSKYNLGSIYVYNDIEEIESTLEGLVKEMNRLVKEGKTKKTLVIFDEFADAVSASRSGAKLDVYEEQKVGRYASGIAKTKRVKVETKKSLEENLKILLQKGRSSGYRIIAATQRASTKVITGDAKVNFPVQICFKVPKDVDSKVVIDEPGAESLAGKGDGLIKSPEYPGITRFQAFYKPQ